MSLFCQDCGCEIERKYEGEELCVHCYTKRYEDMPGGFLICQTKQNFWGIQWEADES